MSSLFPVEPDTDPLDHEPMPGDWKLEEDYRIPFRRYQSLGSPRRATALLGAVSPVLDAGIRTYAGPKAGPNIRSRARRMALDAVSTYDPTRGPLKSHLMSQLQGLRRVSAREDQAIKVPERVALESQRLAEAEAQLAEDLGRPPSSLELADHTGIPTRRQAKLRGYRPGFAEGQIEALSATTEDPGGSAPGVAGDDETAYRRRVEFIYPDLDPIDQAIVEHGLGLHGRAKISLTELAHRLNLTPGALSQRASRIQATVDRMADESLL